ncbi:hypothetical protein ACIQXQ_11385 [Peribacillus sp. NPDC097198]|uniref:hypothetical protein n=1 Tax=Peribacillus sp. NPDC097198 TaxID=3364397 RepID=UPI0038045618
MAKLIKQVEGKKAYIGILSEQEIKEAEQLMDSLLEAIPTLEDELETRYHGIIQKNRLEFAHEYGSKLRELLKFHNVKEYQKTIFFQQIRHFASQDDTLPKDRSESREILDYYYRLANYPLEEAKLINWSEWSQIFDIPALSKDERIIHWLLTVSKEKKISREIFRELTTGLRLYTKNKDLSFLTEDQLNQKLSNVLFMSKEKINLYAKFFTDRGIKPTKARLTQKKKYREKYFSEAFHDLKYKSENTSLKELCNSVFINVYKPQNL